MNDFLFWFLVGFGLCIIGVLGLSYIAREQAKYIDYLESRLYGKRRKNV